MQQPTVARMRAAFLGHGSPMNALESNRFTEVWRSFGAASAAAAPKAILVVSAHWYIAGAAVTAMAQPRTIHDFFGFPRPLFEVQYPAPGSQELAAEIAELLKSHRVALDQESWGIDHGSWSVLVHAFPRADVPVLQLSIDARQPFEWHLDLGTKLAALRERGVLVLGSGNVVHNLRAIDWSQRETGFDWAHRFDDAARALLTTRPEDVISLQTHPDFAKAVPTAEHFLPLLYVAGLAQAAGRPLSVLTEGYTYGSLSMTCYGLDVECETKPDTRPAAALPDPKLIPPQDTNA
jgi:4,5-DOPA dioxygenase extradiol